MIAYQQSFIQAMNRHPMMEMARLSEWLLPFGLNELYEFDGDPFEIGDPVPMGVALCYLVDQFKDLYKSALEMHLRDIPHLLIEQYLLREINSKLVVGLEDLRDIGYGIPTKFYGINLCNENDDEPLYGDSRHIQNIVEWIDDFKKGQPETDIARALFVNIRKSQSTQGDKVMAALAWIYGFSGNSQIDFTRGEFEEGFETTQPQWSSQEVNFMNEVHEEAQEIFADAQEGVLLLQSDPWKSALINNAKIVKKGLKRGRKRHQMEWPGTDDACAQRAAASAA